MAPRQQRSRKAYPYTIPTPTVPPQEQLNRAEPSYILEFFRIEALLRSEDVQHLYAVEGGEQPLLAQYLFNWSVLKGAHHDLLGIDLSNHRYDIDGPYINGPYYPMMPCPFGSDDIGVRDLGAELRNELYGGTGWKVLTIRGFMQWLKIQLLFPKGSTTLFLEIDTPYPWKGIAEKIHRLYESQRQKTGIRAVEPLLVRLSEKFYQIPAISRHSPLIRSPKAWLSYLQCYDLHHCEGLSFGEIAKKIYNAPTGRSHQETKKRNTFYHEAKRAYYKVESLIRFAESHNWPPPKPL